MPELSVPRIFNRLAAIALFFAAASLPLRAADAPAYVPGRLLLGRKDAMDPMFHDRLLRLHGAVARQHIAELGLDVVDVPEQSSQAIAQSLRSTGLFDYVERDYYARTGSTPNDPSFISQWHLRKIAGPDAWSLNTGSASVVVAIIDSGIFPDHPDLAGKLVPGWNFVAGNGNTADVLGHGTAVAGTLAADTNNGIGVAGVSWASRLMPLVVVDANDFAAYSDIAAAIQYAADHGVRIMNISIGGPNPSTTLQNAIDYAWNKGAVVFASAMNNGTSDPYYPAACAHVVGVTATDSTDNLASFSNFGGWVKLAAPGTNILTTMNGGGYGYWDGTSFASPIAAGVSALLLAANPNLTNQQLVSVLAQTADDLGAPGFDPYFGWGRVNAARALRAVQPPPAQQPPAPQPPPAVHRSPLPFAPPRGGLK